MLGAALQIYIVYIVHTALTLRRIGASNWNAGKISFLCSCLQRELHHFMTNNPRVNLLIISVLGEFGYNLLSYAFFRLLFLLCLPSLSAVFDWHQTVAMAMLDCLCKYYSVCLCVWKYVYESVHLCVRVCVCVLEVLSWLWMFVNTFYYIWVEDMEWKLQA